MTSACVAFLDESDVQLMCCTAGLPTWRRPTSYRRC